MIDALSAITLGVRDVPGSTQFYRQLGFELACEMPGFASFRVGTSYLNLIAAPERQPAWWGRAIFYVYDVDQVYQRVLQLGLTPPEPPRDAEWGERFFHLTDPDGHELSFARPL